MSFHEGPKCLDKGPKRLFQKDPKCPIGAEVVGAEVVGAEVSKICLNMVVLSIRFEGAEGLDVKIKGPKCLLREGRSVLGKWPKLLLQGAKVSFHEGPKCLNEGLKCLFQKGPKCPIGVEVVGAEVVGTEVS